LILHELEKKKMITILPPWIATSNRITAAHFRRTITLQTACYSFVETFHQQATTKLYGCWAAIKKLKTSLDCETY
jgi:D-mannonate dehydratase